MKLIDNREDSSTLAEEFKELLSQADRCFIHVAYLRDNVLGLIGRELDLLAK